LGDMIEVSEPEQQHHSTRLYRFIAVAFVVIAVLIASFALYMVFSRAYVTVLSEQRDVEAELIVDISARPSESEVLGSVYQLSKSTSETYNSSSIVTIEMNAEGEVEISSDLYRDQTLIASTRLLSEDGSLFRTKDTVVIPGFGKVRVKVFSDEVGVAGNLPEGTELTIPGLNESTRSFFTVRTVGEMTGGRKEVRMVTATDIAKAEDLLMARIEKDLIGTLREKGREDQVPMSGELFIFETVRSTSDVAAGEEAAVFTLNVTVNGQAVFYDEGEFERRVRSMIADRLPFDRTLTQLNLSGSDMTAEKVDLIGKRANIRIAARGQSVLSAEATGLDPEKLVGITTSAAVQYLESLDGVSSASIKMRPFWALRLPSTADHIKMDIR
jgi:hypothetical protein